MYHPRLYGSFYEMGHKYGKLLYKKANFSIPEITTEKSNFGLKAYQELKNFYPEAIEEIEGFAAGINDKPEKLGAFLLSIPVLENTGQCSVFAYQGDNGVIVGRNYDMLFEFKKFTESSLIAPTGKYAYISQSDVFIGRSDGINEKGLSIAMAFVNGKNYVPGISFHFIIKKVLENCASTQEAIQLITTAKVASSNNFLVADKEGTLAIIESAPQKSHVIYPKKGTNYLYITNQFTSNTMKNYDAGGVAWSKSLVRYQSLAHKLAVTKNLDLAQAKAILSDKCVCLNLRKEKFGTIWSVVAKLNNLEIERAEAKPTLTNYKPETRLAWWLKRRAR
ncbi:putative choloylglycine hydrolase [Mesonia hippocampi]|uniref:Putative choloylglycine hydrolase n=1 Tax=Mesonia hippocampi TaxID=1628250 RepID=A0A840EQ71_9FLAO|nr:C45 family peptidase [Mesonia hippocampi]MBB4119130.1 putative choloylglycine hydrolase [Mesonia hippocampi]